MSPKTVSSSRLETSEVMTPNDANFLGKVFGGRLLALLDLVAYATSSRYAGRICVTASFDRVDFHSSIEVGELVKCVGTITYVGRTSVEVTIEVYATNVMSGESRHTNTARVTMVAVDEHGKPQEVPRLICETHEDRLHFLEGKMRRELRGVQREELERLLAGLQDDTDEELIRLMAKDKLLD